MKNSLLQFACLLLASISLSAAEAWHTFTDTRGRSFEGRVISIDEIIGKAIVLVKKSNSKTELDFRILSDPDIAYLKEWEPGLASTDDAAEGGDEAAASDDSDDAEATGSISSRLYPRSKSEIKAKIREIEKRTAPKGIDREQQKTINQLNIYRYLSWVPSEVVADKKMVEQAVEAAKACEAHGGLSHDLGHFTEISNLASGGSMFSSVAQYINDAGDNNRANRGHRRWCLNPPMAKAGFGAQKSYSAMICMDSSGSTRIRGSWAYPGKGFFPREYLHGNAWSLYLKESAPATKDLTVEVYKLRTRPEKPFSNSETIPGKALPVEYVSSYLNTINFEPQPDPITGRGIYWVRIKGGGLREGYLVELY